MNRDPQILCARSEIDSALNADTRILTVHFKMTALQNAAVNRSGRMNPVKLQARTECAALAQSQKPRPVWHRKKSQKPAQAGIERQNASIPDIQRERAIQIRVFEQARLALPAQAARQNASAAVHGIW